MNKKVLLIDGNSLLHRAFHAIPLLETSKGQYTNAVYGFINMVLRLIREEAPSHIVVAFDKGKKTFRHKQYDDYKGTRKPTVHELKEQFKTVREVVAGIGLHYIELDEYEADDILGAYAKMAGREGASALIVTGDRDALQLIDEEVEVLYTKRGISQTERCDIAYIDERYGIRPVQLIDVKALMGDASDNIPGVPGVGEKTALKLIKAYGDLDGVYEHLADIAGKKIPENLEKHKDDAYLSYDLGTIVTSIDGLAPLETYKYEGLDQEGAAQIFSRLEFNSLLDKLDLEDVVIKEDKKKDKMVVGPITEIDDEDEWVSFMASLHQEQLAVYFDLDQREQNIVIHRVIVYDGDQLGIYHVFMPSEEQTARTIETTLDGYRGQIISLQAKTILQHCPASMEFANLEDLSIMAHLLNPEDKSYGFEEIIQMHVQLSLPEDELEQAVLGSYLAYGAIEKKLREEGLRDLYQGVEKPLLFLLSNMERHGVRVNLEYLEAMKVELLAKIEAIEHRIHEQAGSIFNINSPKQLSVVLFEDLGLRPIKKTKTGYSTNAEVLEKLKDDHSIISDILEYRKWVKLNSTYVEGLLELGKLDDGIIHTTFNQTVTATGRLSSSAPNLQNIPVRSEESKLIRRAFIPVKSENILLAADYSQIELRVLAHLSGDAKMIEAYRDNQDIHTRTASEVFDIPIDMVNAALRRQAKAVNFGIVYGISDYGLSRDLNIPVPEANAYIETYFERYPGVKKFIDDTIEKAKQEGEVRTILNRKRTIKNINNSNYNIRSGAERMAMNTPVQGSAADIIKLAMIETQRRLDEKGLEAAMVLQVHDEIIIELPEDELRQVTNILRESMEQIMDLSVPLLVDMKVGNTWYDMEQI